MTSKTFKRLFYYTTDMLAVILYFSVIIFELIFAIGFTIVTGSFIYSSLKGSPYVPTRKKELDKILINANLKPKQKFYELGCGDGRISRLAATDYKLYSTGIDVNPVLILYAKFLAKINKTKNVQFIKQNIFDTDLTGADIVYIFLMPKLISNLIPKLEKELKKNTIVISHGFTIVEWKKKLYKKIDGKPFSTFYYRKS